LAAASGDVWEGTQTTGTDTGEDSHRFVMGIRCMAAKQSAVSALPPKADMS
jgi:hypothetical protein